MIPRKIYQVWLGDNKPTQWLNTFKSTYSDYEYTLFTENNLPSMFNEELFHSEEKGCAKSDILRYEVLYKYGGIYFDADMICLKKIPDSFLQDDFFTAYESEKYAPGLVNNAVIGCTPKHPVMKMLIEGLRTRDPKLQTWQRFGPKYLTEVLLKNYQGNYKIYGSRWFHPVHWKDEVGDPSRLAVAYVDHKWGTTTETQKGTVAYKDRKLGST